MSQSARRMVSVTVSMHITPKSNQALFPQLRRIFELGVCAAMKG